MTRDELLAIVTASFSHRPDPVPGGDLFCHIPHTGEAAYLARIFDPISPERANVGFAEAYNPGHPYCDFVTSVANGLLISVLSLNGVIEQIDRTSTGIGQPISLRYGNAVGRPANLEDTDMVIGDITGWSSRGSFVMRQDGMIRLIHPSDGNDIADEWPSLEAMLRAELTRLAGLHDAEGRELCTSTDLMHPKGRRWETEVEPESLRH